MFIHAFACYFGLAVTRVIHKKGTLHSPKEGAIYHSDLFSFAGKYIYCNFSIRNSFHFISNMQFQLAVMAADSYVTADRHPRP